MQQKDARKLLPVSVLVPVFNAAGYVARARASIDRQLAQPASIIIYDDGSTDQTLDLARRWMDEDRRVSVIAGQKNNGRGFARQALLKAAQTEWIAWFDIDDLWHPAHLLAHFMKAEDERTGSIQISPVSRVSWATGRSKTIAYEGPVGAAEWREFARRKLPPALLQASFGPRESYLDVGGFDERMNWSEDFEFFLRYTDAGGHIRPLSTPEPLVTYFYTSSHARSEDIAAAHKYIRNKHASFWQSRESAEVEFALRSLRYIHRHSIANREFIYAETILKECKELSSTLEECDHKAMLDKEIVLGEERASRLNDGAVEISGDSSSKARDRWSLWPGAPHTKIMAVLSDSIQQNLVAEELPNTLGSRDLEFLYINGFRSVSVQCRDQFGSINRVRHEIEPGPGGTFQLKGRKQPVDERLQSRFLSSTVTQLNAHVGTLLRKGDFARAAECALEAYSLQPNQPVRALVGYAWAQFGAGSPEDARASLQRLGAEWPLESWLRYEDVRMAITDGDLDYAAKQYAIGRLGFLRFDSRRSLLRSIEKKAQRLKQEFSLAPFDSIEFVTDPVDESAQPNFVTFREIRPPRLLSADSLIPFGILELNLRLPDAAVEADYNEANFLARIRLRQSSRLIEETIVRLRVSDGRLAGLLHADTSGKVSTIELAVGKSGLDLPVGSTCQLRVTALPLPPGLVRQRQSFGDTDDSPSINSTYPEDLVRGSPRARLALSGLPPESRRPVIDPCVFHPFVSDRTERSQADILFDGFWDVCKEKESWRQALRVDRLHVVDSRWAFGEGRAADAGTLGGNVVGFVDEDSRAAVARQYRFALLKARPHTDQEHGLRLIEYAASGCIPIEIGDGAPLDDDVAFRVSGTQEAMQLIHELGDLEKYNSRALLQLRRVWSRYAAFERGDPKLTPIDVVLATMRPERLRSINDWFSTQAHDRARLTVVLHGHEGLDLDEVKALCPSASIVLRQGADATLGDCLNAGMSSGEAPYIIKIDDDDDYSSEFLSDYAAYFAILGDETLLGHRASLFSFSGQHAASQDRLRRAWEKFSAEEPSSNPFAGGTLGFSRALFARLGWPTRRRGGSDTDFVRSAVSAGHSFATLDGMTYRQFRSEDPSVHTWRGPGLEKFSTPVTVG